MKIRSERVLTSFSISAVGIAHNSGLNLGAQLNEQKYSKSGAEFLQRIANYYLSVIEVGYLI